MGREIDSFEEVLAALQLAEGQAAALVDAEHLRAVLAELESRREAAYGEYSFDQGFLDLVAQRFSQQLVGLLKLSWGVTYGRKGELLRRVVEGWLGQEEELAGLILRIIGEGARAVGGEAYDALSHLDEEDQEVLLRYEGP